MFDFTSYRCNKSNLISDSKATVISKKSTNEMNIYSSILVWEFKAISISSYSFYSVIYALAYTCAQCSMGYNNPGKFDIF